MKKVSIACVITAFLFIGCSGNNGDGNGTTDTSNTNSSKNVTDSTRGDKPADSSANMPATPPSKESIDFAMKAAGGGMLEVQLGQLAQQNAKSQRVKDFGRMMITDHSKANDELKSLASANNITLPSSLQPEHQKHLDMMSKLKGDAFDKHYMDMMVSDHKKDIDEFKKEANSSSNDAFKGFAGRTLPVLEKHLDSAKAIHGK